ncbi:tellurite resistance TerB family protein [Suttonella sp. R2A3]|uniref:tellurite resistance TerB family protein n=1 Tax=Suttonella sp. R2A3 TaxID=2908648 RepID=UPI001F3DF1E3|nr:tellurite resistance TerB family protein [Suttonella sp. R2A3]UJF24547.1 tellurite resistance TerB family protein [Suttonella sp. R2A3]
MDLNSLLNNVLSAGQSMMNDGNTASRGNQNQSAKDQFGWLNSFGGGAAATGLLGMLMGGKSGSMSKSMAKYGSLAALGSLAYKAYQSWQGQQGGTSAQLQPTSERAPAEVEQNSEILLQTMIAAASADGRIDAQEKQAILSEVDHSDHEARMWLEQQVNNPSTPAQIAARIGNDKALAAENYLAARMVCGDLDRKEIVFLYELADALNLEENFVNKLEEQAGF